MKQQKNKASVIQEAKHVGQRTDFANLMDLFHLKNSQLDKKFRRCKGRVVLRGDIVRDDSGNYAVTQRQQKSWTLFPA